MQKLMILGASVLQLSLIKKAKNLGLHVIVVDQNKNAVGVKEADDFYAVSTLDVDSILQIAKKEEIDGIMTTGSDLPMKVVGAVSDELKLNSISAETAELATNKIKMINKFKEKKVPSPFFKEINNYNGESIDFDLPFIVKPANNSGSRGVKLVLDKYDISESLNYAKSFDVNGNILIEEYLTGQEISVEGIVIEDKLEIITLTKKFVSSGAYFVETGHVQPFIVNKSLYEEIEKCCQLTIESLNINKGPVHIELFVTEYGPKVIEAGARMGGDFITSDLVTLSTGVDFEEMSIIQALGGEVRIPKNLNGNFCAIKFIYSTTVGYLLEVNGIEEAQKLKNIKKIGISKEIGDMISSIKNSNDRIGYIISLGETEEDAIKNCEKAEEEIEIVVKKK